MSSERKRKPLPARRRRAHTNGEPGPEPSVRAGWPGEKPGPEALFKGSKKQIFFELEVVGVKLTDELNLGQSRELLDEQAGRQQATPGIDLQ